MSAVRSALAEPRVEGAPARVWRDWVIAAAIVIGSVLEMLLRDDVAWPVPTLVVSLIVAAAVLPRRIHPLAMTVLAMGVVNAFSIVVWLAEDAQAGYYSMAWILVIPYSLFRWGSGRDTLIGTGVLVLAWIGGITTDPGTIGEAIGGFTVLALTAALGLVVRSRSTIRQRNVERIKSHEREQLARDLHDTVAHHVSAIAVQAQAGQAVAATEPERAVETLAVIEDAARRTLAEMRTLVGALRDSEQPTLAPLEGVGDLARLVERSSGPVRVELDVTGDVDDLPPLVDAAVFRIAQESVTNSLRHARDVSRVQVRVVGRQECVEVTVIDDGAPGSAPLADGDHSGFGVLGMHERATLLGGSLDAGWSGTGHGWRVQATIPREGAAR